MRRLKLMVLFSIAILVFIGGLGLNILAHEASHYLVADSYGLSPEIHINAEPSDLRSVWSTDSNIAHVSYNSESLGINSQDFWISLVGPLANLLLFAIFLLAYKKSSRMSVKMFLAIPMVISAISFVTNLYPAYPADGYVIFQYLLR